MFYGCSALKSITIGNRVTSIGNSALCRCMSLASITFAGTVAQWQAMKFGFDWNDFVPATEVVCSGGIVTLS
jgi:hypothetical protein